MHTKVSLEVGRKVFLNRKIIKILTYNEIPFVLPYNFDTIVACITSRYIDDFRYSGCNGKSSFPGV